MKERKEIMDDKTTRIDWSYSLSSIVRTDTTLVLLEYTTSSTSTI